jgi:hypothetical protein
VECLEFAVVCADRWAIHLLGGSSSLLAAEVSFSDTFFFRFRV